MLILDCQDVIDEFEENYEKNKKVRKPRKRKKSSDKEQYSNLNIQIDTAIANRTGNTLIMLNIFYISNKSRLHTFQ